jgi:serine phosphatase RsbU (regulator of sigma subunit)
MVNRVSGTVWNSSAGGQFASLFYAQIDPETGAMECCSAGTLDALVITADRVLYLDSAHPPLGSHPGDVYRSQRHVLEHGDSVVILCVPPGTARDDASGRLRREHFSNVLAKFRRASPGELVEAIGGLLSGLGQEPAAGRPMALVVQRK